MAGKQIAQRTPDGVPYLLYLPPKHLSAPLWPLLLCLHGAGELGRDVRQLLSEGATGLPAHRLQQPPPPIYVGEIATPAALSERFVVVSPQTSRGWRARDIAAFTRAISQDARLRIDASRRFVTGVSMGGAGAIAAASTGLFAAAVPVCATGGDASAIGDDTAVWFFHGANDVVVGIEHSDSAHALLARRRAGRPGSAGLKYTQFEHAPAPVGWPSYEGHASWIPAFSTAELYDWLLALPHKTGDDRLGATARAPRP
ncbi:hypothetical protein KFE25_011829 [Diacronema lutheri]|uniref:Feruloyl esterase n=1 Tax=Diacronema lutheri TaxID=2081491 RepID=A0A8J5X6A9_DIALT|nr:hypothetical protein KFE25_011829 [Diacronema lutheri]